MTCCGARLEDAETNNLGKLIVERPDDFMDEYRRLQDETMRQLDKLANDIDAGRIPTEEGLKEADRIVLESQARTEPLLALYQARVRRSKLQTRFMAAIAIVVLLGLAYLVLAHHAGTAS